MDVVNEIGPTVVGVIGLPLLYFQMRSFFVQVKAQGRELDAIRQQVLSGTLGYLYQQQNAIHMFFITNSDLRPYFYERVGAPADNTEVASTCEMILDFFEHIFLQRANLPSDVWEGWKSYMMDMYNNSPALSHFLNDHRNHYGEDLVRELAFAGPRSSIQAS